MIFSSTRGLRSCVNVHWVFSLGSAYGVLHFFGPASAGHFHGYLRGNPSIAMIRTLYYRGYLTLRKRHFCYEIRESLEDNLALNAALAEMVGEIETRWEDDIFFETNRQVSPLNKAVL
jgi:hypothetical protein